MRNLTAQTLEHFGYSVLTAGSIATAHACLRHTVFEVVVVDLLVDTSDARGGWADIDRLFAVAGQTPFILVAEERIREAELVAHGIADVVYKPVLGTELLRAVSKVGSRDQVLTAELSAVVRAYFAALEYGDWDRLESLCTEDVRYDMPSDDPAYHARAVGRDAFLALTRETFSKFASPRFELDEIRGLPQGALVRYSSSWLDAAGARQRVSGTLALQFDQTRIAEIAVRIA